MNDHYRRLEQMYAAAPINSFYNPTMTITEGHAELEFAVREAHCHSAGAVHGSVIFKALDDAAYFAAASLVTEGFIVTSAFNLYFLRPVTSGTLRATGQVVFRSRRAYVAEALLFDEAGKEVARGSGNFVPTKIPLETAKGYGD